MIAHNGTAGASAAPNARPVDRVVDALRELDCAPKQSGGQWLARCPAHDDANPSLAVREGDDGRALVKCYAGCSTESVASALGLSVRDLFADAPNARDAARRAHRPTTCANGRAAHNGPGPRATPRTAAHPRRESVESEPPPRVFPTLDDALASYRGSLGEPSRVWHYLNAEGATVFAVARFDTPKGKQIRPVARLGTGWALKHADAPRPLYALPDLIDADRQEEPAIIVEGEKCADSLRALGFVATTSAAGSNAAPKSEWSPLAGRRLVIMPDADAPGDRYAESVATMLADLRPRPTLARLDLPDLDEGEDAFDWIARRREAGESDDAIRASLLAMLDDAEPVDLDDFATEPPPAPEAPPAYRPFPVDLLPEGIAAWVRARADGLNLDAGFIGPPLLASLAGLIGNARSIRLDGHWVEPCALWIGLVGSPGSGKSPALRATLRPLRTINRDWHNEHRDALDEHRRTYAGVDEAPPEPARRQLLVDDATREAIGALLADNPRGLVVAVDELTGWFGGLDRYRSRSGGDTAFWLQAFNGEPVNVNRKTSAPLHIPHALLSIVGGIQPGPLRDSLGERANAENGLLSRFILAEPPDRVRLWNPGDAAPHADDPGDDAMMLWARRLVRLHPDDEGEPVALAITRDAAAAFKAFADGLENRRHAERSEPVKAALSKARAIGARLALLWELTRWASESPERDAPPTVSAQAMRAGCALAEWCVAETLRVYGFTLFAEAHDDAKREAIATLERVRALGGRINCREFVQANRSRYRHTKQAREALDDLAERGWGQWVKVEPGSTRGRKPSDVFVLAETEEAAQ